jgi:uncharacterized membrane protein YccC
MNLSGSLTRFADNESLQPDLARATRATIAFMVPLIAARAGWLTLEATFVAIAAQNIAMVDVRGAYRFRLGLLVAMTAILAGSVALGSVSGNHLVAAVLATGFMALGAGLWRHLSIDYGFSLGLSSILLFFIAMATPGASVHTGHYALAVLAGGAWGLFLQVANWPFRPQHPLRQSVAESWLAAADFFAVMMTPESGAVAGAQSPILEREATLRAILDKTEKTLEHAAARSRPMVARLVMLNSNSARLATRVGAFYSAFENASSHTDYAALTPALQPVLNALTNIARTVALAVVSRQPEHLATFDVRARRLKHLIDALQARITAQASEDIASGQLSDLLRQIETQLTAVGEALRATLDRAAERAAFSLELFDLHTWTLRPLASALNFSPRVDPALVRYTARIAVLMMLGTAAFRYLELPHGYWLPFTMVVVLQPDYGSTRRRVAQRGLGTLFGSIFGSILLWLRLSPSLLVWATTPMVFFFGFFVKRNYAIAVFFVTIFVVLLTEANGPVSLAFTAERVISTIAGSALALAAALLFWPAWERDRLPPMLARALRANRAYLDLLALRLTHGGANDAEVTKAKRLAETANSEAFSSLQRMIGDPKNQQERLEQAAALANGNQRLTRTFNVLALHLKPGAPLTHPAVASFTQLADGVFETIAVSLENPTASAITGESLRQSLNKLKLPAPRIAESDEERRSQWIFTQFGRATTELSAMLLTEEAASATMPAPNLGQRQ